MFLRLLSHPLSAPPTGAPFSSRPSRDKPRKGKREDDIGCSWNSFGHTLKSKLHVSRLKLPPSMAPQNPHFPPTSPNAPSTSGEQGPHPQEPLRHRTCMWKEKAVLKSEDSRSSGTTLWLHLLLKIMARRNCVVGKLSSVWKHPVRRKSCRFCAVVESAASWTPHVYTLRSRPFERQKASVLTCWVKHWNWVWSC